MTIYLSGSTPQQPAFLYATYPAGMTVTSSPASPDYAAADVLEAEELNGWKPANLTGAHSLTVTFPSPFQAEFFALAGKGLDGVTVEVRGSSDGFVASDVQLAAPAVLSGAIAAWGNYPSASYAAIKYIFSTFGSDFTVKHLACGVLSPLPFPEDGFCAAPLQAEGQHLVSYEGLFLGSVTQRVMRPFSLNFGTVTPAEKPLFDDMVKACVQTAQGLFFVPDLSQTDCHFGTIEKKYKYEPKMTKGMYTIPAIPFTARAADAV
jgi:hypothetical protein